MARLAELLNGLKLSDLLPLLKQLIVLGIWCCVLAPSCWLLFLLVRFAKELKPSDLLIIAGVLSYLAAGMVVVGQALAWLDEGVWYPISVATAFDALGIPEPHPVQRMVGLQKIIDWTIATVLNLPVTAALAGLGLPLVFMAEKQKAHESMRERAQLELAQPPERPVRAHYGDNEDAYKTDMDNWFAQRTAEMEAQMARDAAASHHDARKVGP